VRSCLYEGRVRHARRTPLEHRFEYRVALAYIDLSELDEVFRGSFFASARRPALAWFRRSDYLGDPAVPLERAVRDRVAAATGARPEGPIGVLTQLRTFGLVFNPVSFYYCWDAAGSRLEAIVAEIENTPWGERHAYVLDVRTSAAAGRALRWRFPKTFHVSPFIGMDIEYDWRFTPPGERLHVHMEDRARGERFFAATLALARRPLRARTLARLLLGRPPAALSVLWAIYWNALLLWCRGAPFFAHPERDLA